LLLSRAASAAKRQDRDQALQLWHILWRWCALIQPETTFYCCEGMLHRMNNSYEPPILRAPPHPGASASALPVQHAARTLPAHLFAVDELNELPRIERNRSDWPLTRSSQRNMCIDTTMYPLGSCTMKYNPKIHEEAARMPGFANAHPAPNQPICPRAVLRLMYELQRDLGRNRRDLTPVSLQPAAGAQRRAHPGFWS
jgi:glycine dehydrogenase subunit 2